MTPTVPPETAARRDQRMLIIRGKGGRERLVPLSDSAKRAMADYLALRTEAKLDKSKWLFPSFGESGHLSRQHFARELKTLAAREDLPPCAERNVKKALACMWQVVNDLDLEFEQLYELGV